MLLPNSYLASCAATLDEERGRGNGHHSTIDKLDNGQSVLEPGNGVHTTRPQCRSQGLRTKTWTGPANTDPLMPPLSARGLRFNDPAGSIHQLRSNIEVLGEQDLCADLEFQLYCPAVGTGVLVLRFRRRSCACQRCLGPYPLWHSTQAVQGLAGALVKQLISPVVRLELSSQFGQAPVALRGHAGV